MRSVETVLLLVVLGTVVAVFAGRLRVPAPSLLVVAGLLIGLLPGVPAVRVPPEVVSLVVLPPLLYAASEELPWRDLLAVWRHLPLNDVHRMPSSLPRPRKPPPGRAPCGPCTTCCCATRMRC